MSTRISFTEVPNTPNTRAINTIDTCEPMLVQFKDSGALSVIILTNKNSDVLFFDNDGSLRYASQQYLRNNFVQVLDKSVEIKFST